MKFQGLEISDAHMEPCGFAHLRTGDAVNMVPTISSRKYKKNSLDISELTKSQQLSMRHLYYPVNTPVCYYQKRLIMESLYNNMLIALPKELDTFFIAAVAMLNFHRWFPGKKVVCLCKNAESSSNAAKRFVKITGFSQGICVYINLKKCNRYAKWMEQDIIFATAESIIADFISKEELSNICMLVTEDAHRAVAGSHPLSELIRACIFKKAKFRVLAYTDCKFDKVGQLQLVVMNLQIDLIRSLSAIREEVSSIFASPRMHKFNITISDEMHHIGDELLKLHFQVMEPTALLLYESGIFPIDIIKKVANFSISFLQKKVQNGHDHLAEVYCDFLELLSAYDILMCDGLTAFKNSLQALSARSKTINDIIESNETLRQICSRQDLSKPDKLQCHKLDTLIALLRKTSTYYRQQKSIVVVLCRERDPAFVSSLFMSLKMRLSDEESGFTFFLLKKDHREVISENSIKDKLCNVIIVPCSFDVIEIDVGYVDSIVCMDEGLCALRYTGTIKVRLEGNLSALCSLGYEMNICNFMAIDGTVDCVQVDYVKGLQLCDDVLPMLPLNVIPEIVEYWAQNVDDSEGLLTMIQRLDFHERLASGRPLDKSNLIEDKSRLLNQCMKETFLWQDHLQRFTLLGHSTSSSNMTNVLSRDPEILTEQVLRLQNRQRFKWIDEDSQSSKADDVDAMELHLKDNKNSKKECCEKKSSRKRQAKVSSSKCVTTKAPRLSRIDSASSASFTLLKMFKKQVTVDDFVDRVQEQNRYRERQERLIEIIKKLNGLIRL